MADLVQTLVDKACESDEDLNSVVNDGDGAVTGDAYQ